MRKNAVCVPNSMKLDLQQNEIKFGLFGQKHSTNAFIFNKCLNQK